MSSPTVNSVMSKYGPEFTGAVPRAFPSSGFSGARLWRLSTAVGEYCLRRWPEGQLTADRLTFIHEVLRHAARRGCAFVPVPVSTIEGMSFATADETLWQIEPWMPGEADADKPPCHERVAAAMAALATFHAATRDLPGLSPRSNKSDAIAQRLTMLEACLAGDLAKVRASVRQQFWPELAERAFNYIPLIERVGPAFVGRLREAAKHELSLQPIIRDISREHVLFTGRAVTSIVDFGAVTIDHVAVDLARLIGSYIGDDEALRRVALDTYQASVGRHLSDVEIELIDLLDYSGVLLSPYRWLWWVYVDGRDFDNQAAIVARLDSFVARLKYLVESGVALRHRIR